MKDMESIRSVVGNQVPAVPAGLGRDQPVRREAHPVRLQAAKAVCRLVARISTSTIFSQLDSSLFSSAAEAWTVRLFHEQ